MNPATIDSSTVRLRKQGAGSDVPANVSYAGNTATIDPNADLDPSAVYNVTVAGTVTDANGNQLGADDTWSFTTASLSFIDTTVSDFSAGTPGANTYVSETDNGEVTLKPTEASEFSGSSLPGRLEELPLERPRPRELHTRDRRHRFRRQPPRRRLLRQDHRDLRRPAARSSSGPPSTSRTTSTSASRWTSTTRRTGRSSASSSTAPSTPAPITPEPRPTTQLAERSGRQPAPLPDRVGRDRGPLLRGRGAGGDTCSELRRHADAPDRQRPHSGRRLRRPSTGCG